MWPPIGGILGREQVVKCVRDIVPDFGELLSPDTDGYPASKVYQTIGHCQRRRSFRRTNQALAEFRLDRRWEVMKEREVGIELIPLWRKVGFAQAVQPGKILAAEQGRHDDGGIRHHL